MQVLDSDALARAVTLGSTHVAKRFRLEGKNGLAVGNDADLALVEFETCSLVNPTDLHYRHKISLAERFSPIAGYCMFSAAAKSSPAAGERSAPPIHAGGFFVLRSPAMNSPPDFSPGCASSCRRKSPLAPARWSCLATIAQTGSSLSEAARHMEMSYMKAWLLVQVMNRCFRSPLVTLERGGASGGGAQLTPAGQEVLALYRTMEADALAAMKPLPAAPAEAPAQDG